MKMDINIRKPTEDEIEEMKNNPIWECDPSEFPWYYSSSETCYLLHGKVVVKTEKGGEVEFGAGDLVTFPQGLLCTWIVIEKVRKHYKFE